MPGHDVGVVLHDGEEDLVPLPDMRDAIGRGDEIDRLGGVAGEDDLRVGARIEEAAHALARLLEIGGREVAQIMQPAMHIGVFLAIGALDGVEHELRLLRRGAVVEIDERSCRCTFAREDGEVGADRLHVEGRLDRSEILCRRCEHGHRPLLHSTLTPSQSAEACGKRVAQRLVLDALERLADKGLDQQRAGLRLRDAARLEIEQKILVDLAGGRAVAADHVVGEDLKLGLGIELGRLGQEQRSGHLLAVGLLRAGRDDDLALEDAARLLVEHALEELPARAAGDAVLDQERRVAMLPAAHEEGAGNIELPSLRPRSAHRSGCGQRRHPSRTGRRRNARRRQARRARWRDGAHPLPHAAASHAEAPPCRRP